MSDPRGRDSGTWGMGRGPGRGLARLHGQQMAAGRGAGIGGGGVRWHRRGRTPPPPGMPAEALSSAHLEGPRARCADGRGGDTPSCHRRCPGLSQRARAGEVGTAQADAAVTPPRRVASGRQCACTLGAAGVGVARPGMSAGSPPLSPWAFAASAAPPARGWPFGPQAWGDGGWGGLRTWREGAGPHRGKQRADILADKSIRNVGTET